MWVTKIHIRSSLFEKPEWKRPLVRPKDRWMDNIKMYLKEMQCKDVDYIILIQVRVHWRDFVNTVMKLRVP